MRRSQLYVPGNSEKMIRKSVGLPADSIIIDLEDAVPASEKPQTRTLVVSMIRQLDWGKKELCIRVNGLDTPWGTADLLGIKGEKFDTIVVPKAEGDLSFIKSVTGKNLIALIETPRGLEKVDAVAGSEGAEALSYGVADLAAAAGGTIEAYENNNFVKTRIVTAARAHGLEAIDRVSFDIKNLESFRSDAAEAKSLGFTGKQVIHPDQVAISNEVFTPTASEMQWSKRVVSAYEEAMREGRGAIALDGKLVDAVHYRMAKRILETAD